MKFKKGDKVIIISRFQVPYYKKQGVIVECYDKIVHNSAFGKSEPFLTYDVKIDEVTYNFMEKELVKI